MAEREKPQEEMLEGMDLLVAGTVVRDREPGKTSRARKPKEAKAGAISWKKIATPKVKAPQKCDVCVGAMVAGGAWAAPDPAVYQRTQDGETAYLCWDHTSEQRSIDGLEMFKRGGR